MFLIDSIERGVDVQDSTIWDSHPFTVRKSGSISLDLRLNLTPYLCRPISYNRSLVLLQCRLLELYLIVLSVLILIHCGTGRFCLIFFPRVRLSLNDFTAP